MGQDGEEAAELVATIRGEHVAMKTWFMGSGAEAEALRKQYGPYPSMWKEVLNWPGWKEARKAYLKHTQTSSNSKSGGSAIPRKRRSRWGNAEDNGNNDGGSKRGRSRWGREEAEANNKSMGQQQPPAVRAPPSLPGMPGGLPGLPGLPGGLPGLPGGLVLPGMPTNLSPQQQEEMRRLQGRLRTINEKLQNLESEAARVDKLPWGHRDRSPSPPPVYGPDGKRKNTRAVRWRERYSAERHDILENLMSMNPATRKSGLFKRKRTKKITIPVDEHPTYNFIGLIIGPRGKTQKELEAKTGCKIAIRGRGSVKEGARGRRDGKVMEGDNEPLHVVITGDDQKSVDAATDMIEQMLVVIDDEKNVHKQQQLRELALLNGTLKEDEYCSVCAEKGHRAFECPKRFTMNKPSIVVKCAICGDTSHPTRDCTQKPNEQANPRELDSDYSAFMAELDGKKVDKEQPAVPPGAPATCTLASALPPPPPATNDGGPTPGAIPGADSGKGNASAAPSTMQPPNMQVPPPVSNPPPATSMPPPPPPPPAGLLPPPPAAVAQPTPTPTIPPPPPASTGGPSQYPQGGTNYYGNQQQQQHQPQQQQQQQLQPQQQQHHQPKHQQYQQPQHQRQHQQQNYQQYNNSYNGGQQQTYPRRQQAQNYQQQQYQQGRRQPQHQQQQQYQPHQQNQQQQANQAGNETAGWDYTSYYGYGGGADAGGAGGFNWWE